jgi:hypothetical protein
MKMLFIPNSFVVLVQPKKTQAQPAQRLFERAWTRSAPQGFAIALSKSCVNLAPSNTATVLFETTSSLVTVLAGKAPGALALHTIRLAR